MLKITTQAANDAYSVKAGSSSIVQVGALDSGSITSNFGSINVGSETISTTGTVSGGSIETSNVVVGSNTIGHKDDTALVTLANGLVNVAGELQVSTLDIGGTNVTSSAEELNILDGVTANKDEINLLDGVTAGTVVGGKVLTVDNNKDLSGIRNLTDTSGDITTSGKVTSTTDSIVIGTNLDADLLTYQVEQL